MSTERRTEYRMDLYAPALEREPTPVSDIHAHRQNQGNGRTDTVLVTVDLYEPESDEVAHSLRVKMTEHQAERLGGEALRALGFLDDSGWRFGILRELASRPGGMAQAEILLNYAAESIIGRGIDGDPQKAATLDAIREALDTLNGRRRVCRDQSIGGQYHCTREQGHEGRHRDTSHPMEPEWGPSR